MDRICKYKNLWFIEVLSDKEIKEKLLNKILKNGQPDPNPDSASQSQIIQSLTHQTLTSSRHLIEPLGTLFRRS